MGHPETWIWGFFCLLFSTCVATVRAAKEPVIWNAASPACGGCSYDLAGLPPTGACPECGARYPNPKRELTYNLYWVKRRLPGVAIGWVVAISAASAPWLFASNGYPIPLTDLGRGLRELHAGWPYEIVERMTRNRAFSHRHEQSASWTVFTILSVAPLFSLIPRLKWAVGAMLVFAVAIHLWVLILALLA